jgi:hypothetical protein
MKKGKLCRSNGKESDNMYDIPDGIIANLTRECVGNVHDRNVVDTQTFTCSGSRSRPRFGSAAVCDNSGCQRLSLFKKMSQTKCP